MESQWYTKIAVNAEWCDQFMDRRRQDQNRNQQLPMNCVHKIQPSLQSRTTSDSQAPQNMLTYTTGPMFTFSGKWETYVKHSCDEVFSCQYFKC